MLRKIVKIDEEKCDGCGLCIPSCAEGAIQIIDGKARLVSDIYCDGLGACLGECPQDAISIEEREAPAFDEEAANRYVAQLRAAKEGAAARVESVVQACSGTAARSLKPVGAVSVDDGAIQTDGMPSALTNWPVQLALAPLKAPYFDGASLLIVGDCVPTALADFHRRLLAGNVLLVGCPKLDNSDLYRRKLSQIFAQNDICDITIAYMEVPCCFGLVHLVRQAIQDSGKNIPLMITKVSIQGEICATYKVEN